MYGHPIGLTFNGRGEKNPTTCGGCCSYLTILVLLVVLVNLIFCVSTGSNDVFSQADSAIDNNEQISLTGPDGVLPVVVLTNGYSFEELGKYVNFETYTAEVESASERISMRLCSLSDFESLGAADKYENLKTRYGEQNLICPGQEDVVVAGSYDSPNSKSFILEATDCIGNDCEVDQTLIDAVKSSLSVDLWLVSQKIDW